MAVGHDSLAQGDRHAGSASARWEGSSREERNGRGCSASCSWWVRQPARLRFAMSCASQPLCRPLPCSLRSLVMSVSRPFCSRRLTLAPITLQAARDARSPPTICLPVQQQPPVDIGDGARGQRHSTCAIRQRLCEGSSPPAANPAARLARVGAPSRAFWSACACPNAVPCSAAIAAGLPRRARHACPERCARKLTYWIRTSLKSRPSGSAAYIPLHSNPPPQAPFPARSG
jgi:hypothetical protein